MTFRIEDAWVLVAAAGQGARMLSAVPKSYMALAGEPVLQHTLSRCLGWSAGLKVMLVADPAWLDQHPVPAASDARVRIVAGGSERADSVLNGLSEIANHAGPETPVLVHDAARPLVRRRDVVNLFDTIAQARNKGLADGGLLAAEVTDTIKSQDNSGVMSDTHNQPAPCVAATVPRAGLWRALTPQLFLLNQLQQALTLAGRTSTAQDNNTTVTDEASAMELAGHRVLLVKGASDNIKITFPQDLLLAEALLRHQRCS